VYNVNNMDKFKTPAIIILVIVSVFLVDYWLSSYQDSKEDSEHEALMACADFIQENLDTYTTQKNDYRLHDDLANCLSEYSYNN